MITLENDQITARINPVGAELTSLVSKKSGLEYMWNGDPAVWGKHSPVLFPIVGTLKENSYRHDGRSYSLGRHGFAREKTFAVESGDQKTAGFLLTSDEETLALFPFHFEFRVLYELRKSTLNVTYEVTNDGEEELFFSVGGHPAFALPLAPGTEYADYYLEFEQKETAPRWPISPEGLIENSPLPFLDNQNIINLSKELFQKDAIVLKNLSSSAVALKSAKTSHGFLFDYADFPYLGIWAAKNADFLCIEPWCGIADSVNSDQQLANKEGIEKLEPEGVFSRTWSVELF